MMFASLLTLAAWLSTAPASTGTPFADVAAVATAHSVAYSTAAALPPTAHYLASAAEAGFSVDALVHAEASVLGEIRRGGFPGAALAIGRREKVVVERGIGHIGWDASDAAVDADASVYDLASLTKIVATTTAVMLLYEDGRLLLDAPVSLYLPEFQGVGKEGVTIRHLLMHNSGLPAGADLWAPAPAQSLARAIATQLRRAPGVKVEYSDIGFVVLWTVAERVAGEPLYALLDRRVYGPLGMRLTTFLPGEACASCVPTERRRNGEVIRGRVHDPTAFRLGGVAGNAGLFSTAHDLARYAAMLASGGEIEGTRVFRRETIEEFTRRQPGAGTRALGWDTPARDGSGAAGLKISPHAFGHTGFTGTSLWIDPDRGTWAVILSNRTYQPQAPNRIQALRRQVHDWVATACDDGTALGLGSAAAMPVATH